MSRDPRGRRGKPSASSRRDKNRGQGNPRGLRVIEGGRGDSDAGPEGPARVPSRRHRTPRRVKIRRRIAFAVMTLMAAGLITYVLLGPVTRVLDSRSNLARAEDQLAEERSRTQSLEERKAWDLTDRFVEWEARKMGYVKPGEIPIIVLDEEEEQAPESTPSAPAP